MYDVHIITLTAKEAKNGCVKAVYIAGLTEPIHVQIPPNTYDGFRFYMEDVQCLDENGCTVECTIPMEISVVKPKKNRLGVIFLTLVLLLSVAVVDWNAVWDDFTSTASNLVYYNGPELVPENTILYFPNRYFLSQLEGAQLQTVCLIYAAAMDFQDQCMIPEGITKTQLSDLLLLMKAECPELFQLDVMQNTSCSYYTENGYVFAVKLEYQMTESEYLTKRASCEAVVDYYVKQLKDATPEEKEEFVFTRMAKNCWYHTTTDNCGNAYGAFVDNKAKCDGVSLGMKWCLEALGMQCLCILGDPRDADVGHAWNMVCLNGAYYNVDLTASMRHESNQDSVTADWVLYYAYNVADRWTEEDYIVCQPLIRLNKPVCDTDAYSYYAQMGHYVGQEDDLEQAAHMSLTTVYKQRDTVVLHFASKEDCAQFYLNFSNYIDSWKKANAFYSFSVQWMQLSENYFCIMRK